jgi:hypothetical protein
MSGPVVVAELPDFDNPPVIEIVAAAQFVALPRLSLADMVHVGQQPHRAVYLRPDGRFFAQFWKRTR